MKHGTATTQLLIGIAAAGVASTELVPQPYPDAARRTRCTELFRLRIYADRRAKGAVGAGEELLAHDTEVGIPSIEQIVHPCEDMQALADPVLGIEVDHTIAGDFSVRVPVVLIPASVDGTRDQQIDARRPLLGEIVVRP